MSRYPFNSPFFYEPMLVSLTQQKSGRIFELWVREERFAISPIFIKIPLYFIEYIDGRPVYKWRVKKLKTSTH